MRQLSEATQNKLKDLLKKVPEDEQEAFIIRIIARDFWLYCERNLMIKDKMTGAVVPFELNWAQKKFMEMVLDDVQKGIPVRYIILKARQMGISTVIEALCYWWTATHKNITSAIVAHEKDASKNLYKMFRRFYENSHPLFRPSLKYNTKDDLTFDVEDEVKQLALERDEIIPGLGSEIATMVAKDDAGRSGTNHFVHGSEVAMWEGSADIVSGLLQTVPMAPKTFIFLESTAKGIGNYFFVEWFSAERGESQFKPFFLAWHDQKEYESHPSGGKAPYSEREKKLINGDPELEGADVWSLKYRGYNKNTIERKISWRRKKIKEFSREPEKFDQEYPDNPMVAFLATGSYAFSVGRLLMMQSRAKEYTDLKYGSISVDQDKKHKMSYVPVSPLKVFKEPVKNRKYVVGADVAEGIEVSSATGKEGDWSVADVMDAETWETVAKYRAHIDPDLFGDVIFDIATYYNTALVGVEANNHGIVTIQNLKKRFYRNLYEREPTPEEQEFDKIRTTLLGWLTNKKTKPLMIRNLASAIRDNQIIDYDLVFIGEAMVYTSNERGVYGDKEGGHDDTVMAKAIALQLADFVSYDVQLAKEKISKPSFKTQQHGNDDEKPAKHRHPGVRSARKESRALRRQRGWERQGWEWADELHSFWHYVGRSP